MITNQEIRGKARCADYVANKPFFDRMKCKIEVEITVTQFLID